MCELDNFLKKNFTNLYTTKLNCKSLLRQLLKSKLALDIFVPDMVLANITLPFQHSH